MPFNISPIKPQPSWRLYTVTKSGNEFDIGGGKTLAEYGFTNARLHRENLAPDTFTVSKAAAKFDDSPDIAYGQLVALQDPRGVQRFIGTRIIVPGSASSDGERQQWEFAGPWYWLQKLVYRQTWKQLLINGSLLPRTTSHLLLNAANLSVAGQIQAVAQFAIDQGAPFQLGTIDIPVVPFVTEITDQTCAQVIADQLRFCPDAVAWFDYSTTPPTFHVRRSSDLAQVNLTLGPGQTIPIADEGLSITSRPDQQVTSVSLRYERTDTLNDKQYLQLGEDIYPVSSDGGGLNAVHATITLAGYKRTTVQATITCETIDTNSLNWWKRVIPRLQDPRIKNLSVANIQRVIQGSRTDGNANGTASSGFGRMLVEGQLADWMADVADVSLDWEQEECSAEFTFDLDVDSTSGVKLEKVSKLRIPVQLVATTAPAGESTYWALESEEEGEQQPIGLAQYLYESMSGLEYEGSVSTTQQEVTGYIGPGNRLNVLGTQDAGHASMAARIQSVDELIDTGTTLVRFGGTPALSLGSILEFMRASRHRRRWTRTSVQETGENPSDDTVELGEATANLNTVPGDQQNKLFACVDGSRRIEMDSSNGKLTIETLQKTGKVTASVADDSSSIILIGNVNNTVSVSSKNGESAAELSGSGGNIYCRTAMCKGKTLYPREETWCDAATGTKRKIMVLCSEPYD